MRIKQQGFNKTLLFLSYSDLDKSGDIDNKTEILEEHTYYPFGLKHKGYNQTVNTENEHKFRFNDTEFDDDFDLNWYNMPLRHQDPTTGRWNGIDPVTHFSTSTYSGYENNPVFWADPSGANVWCQVKLAVGVTLSNPYARNGIKAARRGNQVRKIAGGNDWYSRKNKNGSTSLLYRKGNAESIKVNGEDYDNIGVTTSVQNIDGTYTIYYQNAAFVSQNLVTEGQILASRIAVNALMNILSGDQQKRLLIASLHKSTGIAAEVIFEIANITLAPEEFLAGKIFAGTMFLAKVGKAGSNITRVGRWMSHTELEIMKKTGRVAEGAGGQTFVSVNGVLDYMKEAKKGSIYVEFDVLTKNLVKGGKEGWFKMLGPNSGKAMKRMLDKQGGELLPLFENLSEILRIK